jgi:hypothetical protein
MEGSSTALPCEYHNIGQYYRALSIRRRYGVAAANVILESVATSAATPLRYRARALHAIGAHYFDIGKRSESLRFFLEAGHAASPKHGCDLLTATFSPWMIAVIKSVNGDHNGAMVDLENLFPLVRLITPEYPQWYYFYANALAVELGELGKLEQAQHTSHIALASPYASVNPEWHETAKENQQKARRASRSVVAISRKEFQREDHAEEEISNEQASLITRERAGQPGSKLLQFRRRGCQIELCK